MPQIFIDEIEDGSTYHTRSVTITEAHIVTFCGITQLNESPFMDEEWALTKSPFGRRVAPGPLTMTVGLALIMHELGGGVALRSFDSLRFKAPVFPGDTLTAHFRLVSQEPGREGLQKVALHEFVTNQREETVAEWERSVLLRPKSAGATPDSTINNR